MKFSLCLTLCLLAGCLSQPVRVSHAPAGDHGKRLAVVSCVADHMTDERLRDRLEVRRLLKLSTERAGMVGGGWPEFSKAVNDAIVRVDTGKDGVPVALTDTDRKTLAAGLRKAVRGVKP